MQHQLSSARFTPKVLLHVIEQASDPNAVFTLHVSDAPNEKVIYFAGGGVRVLSCGDRNCGDVTSELLKDNLISIEQLHEVLEAVRKQQRTLKEALTEKNLLQREEYDQVVDDLIRREFFDLVFWNDASYLCYPGSPPKGIYETDRALVGTPSIPALEEDVEAWTKQWECQRRKLHSDRAIISATRAGTYGLEKLDGDAKRCLELCLNGIDLRSLWIRLGIDLPEICDHIWELIENGWVNVEPPARSEQGKSEILERIASLEAGLDEVIGKDLVREKLVSLYRRTDQNDKAVAELRSLAESSLREGQWPLAVERLKQALSVQPENLEVLEQVLGIYLDQRLEKEAMAIAHSNVDTLINGKKQKEAKAAGKLIKRLTGGSLESRSIFAAISAGGGDVQGAVEQYLELAREYAENGSKNEAIRILEAGLRLSPEHPDLEAELCKLEPSFAAKLDRLRNKKKRNFGPIASGRLIAILLVFLTIGVLELTRIYPLSEKLGALVANATGSAEFEQPGKNGGRDVRNPEDAKTEIVGGVEIPIKGEEGLDVKETFGSGRSLLDLSHTTPTPARSVRVPADSSASTAPRDSRSTPSAGSSTRGTAGGTRSVARRSSTSTRPPRELDVQTDGAPRLNAPYAHPNFEVPRVRLPSPTPPSQNRDRNPLHLSRPDPRDMSSGKARVVGGLSLLPYQSDDDWLRGGRPVGQQTLDRVAAHVTQGRTFAVITRLVDRDLLVAFAPSAPLVGANPETGGELFRFPGRNGFRWAIGHRAARICRWGIGYQPLVFRPTSDQPRRIQWVVPAGTEALAIGFEHVAIRIGSQTFLYTIGGEPLQGSALIEWDEGLFVDDFLVLTRRRHDERGSPGVWVVHTDAWLPVWCSVEGPHGPEVR